MNKPIEARQTNLEPMIPAGFEPVIRGNQYLRNELSYLIAHTEKVADWNHKLPTLFPCLTELTGSYKTEFEGMSQSSNRAALDEFKTHVFIEEQKTGQTRLFWFDYASRAYPEQGFDGIKKGITIREHVKPTDDNWRDCIKKEKWTQALDPQDPLFEQVTAMSLMGMVGLLTKENESHINTLIQAYAEQRGIAI